MTGDRNTGPGPAILPVAGPAQSAAWLLDEFRRRPWTVLSVVLLGALTAVAAVVPVLALGELVDRVTHHAAVSSLIPIAAIAGGSAIVGGVVAGVTMNTIARLGADLLADLRESAMIAALTLPRAQIEASGRGDLLSRVSNDVAAINRAVTSVLPTTVTAVGLTVVSLIAMAALDWRLGLAGLVSMPFYVVALRWYLPRSGPVYAQERRAAADRAQTIVEALGGRATVSAYSLTQDRMQAIESASRRTRDLSVSVFAMFTRLVARVNRAEFAGLTTILAVGYVLVSNHEVSVGAVTAAALLFHRLFNPIGMILYSSADLQLAGAGLARLIGVTLESSRAQPRHTLGAAAAGTGLSLRGVHFAYDSRRPILCGIDLDIPAGTRLALVGASGAGKSTVAGLADGSLSADAGVVQVCGERRVHTVSQEVHVFAGRLIDDLKLGAPEAGEKAVRAALRTVHAQWAFDLPDGLDTVVGEGGYRLTDAQCQQVALARLVLADPDVAILDEATAEAGSRHATELEAAALAATQGRTTLVIAHRLSQARSADAVAVLVNGVIREYGSPDDLIAADGEFARLWTAWAASLPGRHVLPAVHPTDTAAPLPTTRLRNVQ